MTDNEIIKAFKDFLNEQADGYTDHVETGGERYEFIEKELELLKETDNLINHQKAENKRLREEKSKLENKIDEIYPLVMQLPNAMQQAKAEAIKEFAERVQKKLDPTLIALTKIGCVLVDVSKMHITEKDAIQKINGYLDGLEIETRMSLDIALCDIKKEMVGDNNA